MQYIILFLNISNRVIKGRFRSIATVVENFARYQTKIIGACMYHWTSCTYKKLCMNLAFVHIMLCHSQMSRCMWSISDKHLEKETMMRVCEEKNYLKSPIPWCQARVVLCAASCLVTRLESQCEGARCENRAPLVVGSFSIAIPFTNMVDCKSSMLQAGVEPYIMPKMILFPEWRGNLE